MCRIYLILYITLMFALGYWAANTFRQERATLKMANPKYLKDVVVFTGRKSRHDVYLTNMTVTFVRPIGNNVSFGMTLSLKTGGDFRVTSRACDSVKSKWSNDFMKSYTNLSIDKCPFAPGRYIYMNMELPPKNIPVPIADGDYFFNFDVFLTATKEVIMKVVTVLHFDRNGNSGKGKKG